MRAANTGLFWLAAASAAWILIAPLRNPHAHGRSWLPIGGGMLILALALHFLLPAAAGYVLAGVVLVFGIYPSYLFQRLDILTDQARYEEAERLWRRARWLHPAKGSGWATTMLQANALAANGDVGAAKELVERFEPGNPAFAKHRAMALLSLGRDWGGMARWIEAELASGGPLPEPSLITRLIRAKGEQGEIEDMLSIYARYEAHLAQVPKADALAIGFILSFCGDIERSRRLWELAGERVDQETMDLWMGTAYLASGWREKAAALLEPLASSTDHVLRQSAAHRLEHGEPANLGGLTPKARATLFEIKARMDQPAADG
ncbi:MAG TPA: hypothetical protein VGE07_17415 [Herpetosiphonaceae bacterium]